jgi:hypothetical protein
VLADEPPARLATRLRPASRVDVEALAPGAALAAAVAGVAGVRRVESLATTNGTARCRVELEPGRDARPAIAESIATHGWPLLALAPVETTLEEAFFALIAAREAERESARVGRRGPGASEQRSAAEPREQRTGPQVK